MDSRIPNWRAARLIWVIGLPVALGLSFGNNAWACPDGWTCQEGLECPPIENCLPPAPEPEPEPQPPAPPPPEEEPPTSPPPEEEPPTSTPPEPELPPEEEPEPPTTPPPGEPPTQPPPEEPQPPGSEEPEPPLSPPPEEEGPTSPPQSEPVPPPSRPPAVSVPEAPEHDTGEAMDLMRESERRSRRDLEFERTFPIINTPTRERDPDAISSQIDRLSRTRERNPTVQEEPEDEEDIFLTPGDPPPTIFGEELEERETCCGIKGNLIFVPFTQDPQEIRDVQFAVHDDRTVAHNVMPHSGGYLEMASDLFLPSFGIDFAFNRVYRSDVQFESGGLLGNHWDFNLNKRIVPVFTRINEDNLGVETMNVDTPRLYYFDGTGHQDLYIMSHQEVRTVVNFGEELHTQKRFRAFVTTYKSPPHEFLEIQRYIVETPDDHPFKDHPNVQTEFGETIFYVVRHKHGQRLIFNCRGQLIFMFDRHNNKVELRYGGPWNPLTQNRMLSLIIDTANRMYSVETRDIGNGTLATNDECRRLSGTYPIPRLSAIRDPAGRRLEFEFDQGREVVLKLVRRKYPDSRTVHFEYSYEDADYLTAIVGPREYYGQKRPMVTNRYDASGRVVQQQVAERQFDIVHWGNIEVTASEGAIFEYALTDLTDTLVIASETVRRAGDTGGDRWTTRYTHNNAHQVTRINFPRGNSMQFVYALASSSVARGTVRNWLERDLTYENNLSAGNLLGVVRTTHQPNMRVEYENGAVRIRHGDEPVPGVPEYTEISESFSYEPLFNQLETFIDPADSMTTYTFDYLHDYGHLGVAVSMQTPAFTRPDGTRVTPAVKTFGYSPQGDLVSATQGGMSITRGFNQFGWLESESYPDGNALTFSFRADGYVTREELNGYAIEYERDGRGYLTQKTIDPDGHEIRIWYTHDLAGNLEEMRQEVKDLISQADVDRYGLTADYRGTSKVVHEYDQWNRIVSSSFEGFDAGDGSRNTSYEVTYGYDVADRLTDITGPSPTGTGTTTTHVNYGPRGLISSLTSGGETVTYEYDENGNQFAVQDARGRVTRYVYDGFDRLLATIDHEGGIASQFTDPAGNVIRVAFEGETGAGQGQRGTLVDIGTDFDEYNRPIARRELTANGEWVTSRMYYNAEHLLEREEGPGAGETVYTYDAVGRLVTLTDPLGNVTTYGYSSGGEMSSITESETVITYDAVARRTSTEERTFTTELGYDIFGQLSSRAARGQAPARMWYDSRGLARVTIDEAGRRTTNTYDSRGRLVGISRNGVNSTFTYNAAGAKVRANLPGGSHEWEYNEAGQLSAESDLAAGRKTDYHYGKTGDLLRVGYPNGTGIAYSYDSRGRVTEADFQEDHYYIEGPGAARFDYDGLGRITEAVHGGTRVRRDYDGVGNVLVDEQTLEQGTPYAVRSEYSPDLSRKTVSLPAIGDAPAVSLTWDYDPAGRVERVSVNGDQVARYEYSGSDRVGRRVYGNSVQTVWEYDQARRPVNMFVDSRVEDRRLWSASGHYLGNTLVDQRQFFSSEEASGGRSSSSRIELGEDLRPVYVQTAVVSPGLEDGTPSQWVSREFQQFDRDNRLIASLTATFVNDNLAEVRSADFTYDGGRITQASLRANHFEAPLDLGAASMTAQQARDYAEQGSHSEVRAFDYDENGNLLEDGQFSFRYDVQNRLIEANMGYDGGYNANAWVKFRFDALGRRVYQQNDGKALSREVFGQPDIQFLYHGRDVVAEVLHRAGEEPVLLAVYVHGARPGEIVKMYRRENDDPDAPLVGYYLHEGLTGGIGFTTDDEYQGAKRVSFRRPLNVNENLIEGTNTRLPYTSWRTRYDPLIGAHYDESTTTTQVSFKRAPQIETALRNEARLRRIQQAADELAIAHLKIMAIVTLPVTLPAAASSVAASGLASPVVGGLFSVGVDYGITSYVGGDYTFEQGMTSFALGGLGAGMGASLGRFSSLGTNSRIALEAGVDIAGGTVIDYAQNGGSLSNSLVQNLLFSGVGAAGARVQAAVGSANAHHAVSSQRRMKMAPGLAETIEVEEFTDLPPRKETAEHWREDTNNGRTLIAAVEDALRTQFVRRIDENGKPVQIWIVRRLLADLDSGSMQWDTRGARLPLEHHVMLDPDMRPVTRGSTLPSLAEDSSNRISLNAFDVDGNRASPTQIALTLIHEYAHYLGANERTARRIQYMAYKRLERNNHAGRLGASYRQRYVEIDEKVGFVHSINTKDWRKMTMDLVAEELRVLPSYRDKLHAFERQPKSWMIFNQPEVLLVPEDGQPTVYFPKAE